MSTQSTSAAAEAPLIDSFGRVHTDLRVSLTDRCSLRCTYCMPAEGVPWLQGPSLLTTEEILRLIGVAVDLGVTTVRLTGGEPLLRPDVVDIVQAIRQLPAAPEVSLTTNALRLPGLAAPLADAGLTRVNISLDTLDRETFRNLTRRDRLVDTLAGVAAAKAAGLAPVKINTVLMRGVNEHEAPALLSWALAEGLEWRFIEQMPLDPQHQWDRSNFVTASETIASLQAAGFTIAPLPVQDSAPANRWRVQDTPPGLSSITTSRGFGVIASVSEPFCGSCDRIRLTADGHLRSCLFARDETDLRTALRQGAPDNELQQLFLDEVRNKKRGHGINEEAFQQPQRPMSAIGG